MPTVLRVSKYRFHFYSDEGSEPPHIHVDAGDCECKFWLSPVGLARNRGMNAVEIRKVERLVYEHLARMFHKLTCALACLLFDRQILFRRVYE